MIAVGCGGSHDEQARPSKAEFLEKANTACEKARAGAGERVADFLAPRKQKGSLTPVDYGDLAHFVMLPTIESEIAGIVTLFPVPAGEGERIDDLLYAERREIDILANTEKIDSIEAVERHFNRSGRMLRAYGLTSCANGLASH